MSQEKKVLRDPSVCLAHLSMRVEDALAQGGAVPLQVGIEAGEEGALLEIVRLGHPILRQVAEPLPRGVLGTPVFRRYIRSMMETMFEASGVGLAAPQVADGLRCFVYYVPGQGEDLFEVKPRILVNPEVTLGSMEEEGWEGCLSIPGLRGRVPRAREIEVVAYDSEGERMEFIASGFHARVIQHELDHLDGIVFLDRMHSMSSLAFEEEWSQYVVGGEEA
jgi:peptide deformylase